MKHGILSALCGAVLALLLPTTAAGASPLMGPDLLVLALTEEDGDALCDSECSTSYPGLSEVEGCDVCFCGDEAATDPVSFGTQPEQTCRFALDRQGDETPATQVQLEDLCVDGADCVPGLLQCLDRTCGLVSGFVQISEFGQEIAFIPEGYTVKTELAEATYQLSRYDAEDNAWLEISCTEGQLGYTFTFAAGDETVWLGPVSETCPECVQAILVNLTEETITPLGADGDVDTDGDQDDAEGPSDPGEADGDAEDTPDGDAPSDDDQEPILSPGEVDGDTDGELQGITICRRECRCNQPLSEGFAGWLVLVVAGLGLWFSRRRVERN